MVTAPCHPKWREVTAALRCRIGQSQALTRCANTSANVEDGRIRKMAHTERIKASFVQFEDKDNDDDEEEGDDE